MRLGQLARKLSLRPAQLVEFLAKNNIQIEESSNTRLEDSHVNVIVQHFAPDSLGQIVEEVDELETPVQIEKDQPIVEPVVPESESVENQNIGEPEVIRVPKIELSGLKVLGKIELPEPKRKEINVEQTEESETNATSENLPALPAVKHRDSDRKQGAQKNRERSQQRQWKNPLELQRESEAREAEKKKRITIEREKEKRKRYYEGKVKSITQPKRVKPVKDQQEVKKKPVDTRPVPKTWFGKFLRWWTT